MITSYKKAKEDVLKCYDEFLKVVEKSGMISDDTSIRALASQAEKVKDDKFSLMIAGEAKSGKSTFINAYLGTEILPMDVRQCTSSVVEIRYGTEFTLNATYADGRERKVIGQNNIKQFLAENAALDDEYRDIPITTINNEIIVKYKEKKIFEVVIQDLLKGVERENIHRLPQDIYNNKIRRYIKEKQCQWRSVVVKIDIEYPFEDKNMRGIRIIDSPGVNAAGKVGDVTDKYIESADAIIFLKPIVGSDTGSNSFKDFLESKSVDRNKNAMFLVLTMRTAASEDDVQRKYEDYVTMFGAYRTDNRHGIIKEQIIPVDSKAELYFNKFDNMSTEEIKVNIKELRASKKAESFLTAAWFDAESDKDAFLKELKRYSNFNSIDQSLNRFGRKAQFIALSEFLGRMLKVYIKIAINLREKIDNYALKAEDPEKLAIKVAETQEALTDIENKMNQTVDEISAKYAGSSKKGIIAQRAEEVMAEYIAEIEQISGTSDSSLEQLEKISLRKVDKFVEFEADLQKNVVAECNKALIALSDKNALEFMTLEPDFSKEVLDGIKESMRDEAKETYSYTTGTTFKKTHTRSRFSQDKFYGLVRDSINDRIESIKLQAIRDLRRFVTKTASAYTMELAKNAEVKKNELKRIKMEKRTAEEIAEIIESLNALLSIIEPQQTTVKELKGGIDGNV